MKGNQILLALLVLVGSAIYADKCGCSKPRPAAKPAARPMPKPAPQRSADAKPAQVEKDCDDKLDACA